MDSHTAAKAPRASMQLNLIVAISEEGPWHVASCDMMDLHAQGRTEEEAVQNFVHMATDFFQSCLQRRTLDAVLSESGLLPFSDAFCAPPVASEPDERLVNVCVPLVSGPAPEPDCEHRAH